MLYGDRSDVEGDYSELMAKSVFCLHLPGTPSAVQDRQGGGKGGSHLLGTCLVIRQLCLALPSSPQVMPAGAPIEALASPPPPPLSGDGWSSRFEESILHGCIPVVIMDWVSAPFENILDHRLFTVRVAQVQEEGQGGRGP